MVVAALPCAAAPSPGLTYPVLPADGDACGGALGDHLRFTGVQKRIDKGNLGSLVSSQR